MHKKPTSTVIIKMRFETLNKKLIANTFTKKIYYTVTINKIILKNVPLSAVYTYF